MKKYILKSIIIIASIVPFTSHAAGWFVLGGTIDEINVESGLATIKMSGENIIHHDGCDATYEVVLQDETNNGDRQYALLMAAYMTGKKVNVYTSGCYHGWGKKYPKVYAVRVKN